MKYSHPPFLYFLPAVIFFSVFIVLVLPRIKTLYPPKTAWKTYTNNFLGYSLRYPPDWELHPEVSTYLSSPSGLGMDFKEESFNLKLSTFKENAGFWLNYYLSSTAELGNAQDKIIKEESIPLGGTAAIKNTISYRFPDMKSTGTAIWIYAPLSGDHLLSIKYYSDTSNPRELNLYNQILSTLKFFPVSPTPDISDFVLPEGLDRAQLQSPVKIDDKYFVIFQKSCMNFPINSPVQRSGVLSANASGPKWNILFEIRDIVPRPGLGSPYKNNPYEFWKENDSYYSVIVDNNGGGSGEGYGKLVQINPVTGQWQIIRCFYFSYESFYQHWNSFPDSTPKSQRVISFDNKSNIQSVESCTNFTLNFP